MSLSGQQRKELQLALIDAFPTTESLQRMLDHELGKNLEVIAGQGSLDDIIFKLIKTAEAQGWVKDLVSGAYHENPRNPQLRYIEEKILNQHEDKQLSNIPVSGFQVSEVGANYTQLRDLLLTYKFKEADEETFRIMLFVASRDKQGWLEEEDLLGFPQRDLCTIDKLWVASSDGRFGFSVQKQIKLDLMAATTKKSHKDLSIISLDFFDRVGWTKTMRYLDKDGDETENGLIDLRSPKGHLPQFALKNQASPKKLNSESPKKLNSESPKLLMDYVEIEETNLSRKFLTFVLVGVSLYLWWRIILLIILVVFLLFLLLFFILLIIGSINYNIENMRKNKINKGVKLPSEIKDEVFQIFRYEECIWKRIETCNCKHINVPAFRDHL